MNLTKKIAKESTITFSGMVYGNINRYLYTALLARWVGVEYLGIYSLANAIMLIGEVIAKIGSSSDDIIESSTQVEQNKQNENSKPEESIEEKEALSDIASDEPRLQYHGAKPLYASR